MRVARTMINGQEIAHGGYVFILADTAFSCASNSHGPVTIAEGADITFLMPVREGEICYWGPGAILGYWRDPGRTAAAIDPGQKLLERLRPGMSVEVHVHTAAAP